MSVPDPQSGCRDNRSGISDVHSDRLSAGARDSADVPDHLGAAELIDLERAQIGHDVHDLLLPLIFAASANLQSVLRSLDDAAGDRDPASLHQASGSAAQQSGSAAQQSGSAAQQSGSAAQQSAGTCRSSILSDRDVYNRIAQAEQWTREALQAGRNLLGAIYPPELGQMPWLTAARDAVSRIAGPDREIAWTVDADSPVCDPEWNREMAAVAYRVLVEAIRNAIRHGAAETIAIRCHRDQLLIVDDGKGFDPATVPPDRYGIRAMRGRASLVGKSLSIESSVGGPTRVRLPL